jgi:sulfide dehydrogenase cytochrome subunit
MFNRKKLTSLTAVAIFCLSPISILLADDATLVHEKCGICHGDDGNSLTGEVPSIAGFTAASLSDFLEEYKEGDREAQKFTPENGKESDMQEVAKDLSEEDGLKIFFFLSKQTFKPIKQDFDANLAKKGKKLHKKKCEKCHSDYGSSVEDDTPKLAGQWKPYLEKQFTLFADKKRDMPKKMKKKFKKLSEEDHKALIEFYASQQ